MELVPIIQRVLTIVAILAVATLFISYIAFKIRQKRTPEQVYTKDNSGHLEPSFVGKSIRRITRITKEILPLNPSVPPKPQQHHSSKHSQPAPAKKVEPKPQYQKPKRIEVVNNLSEQNLERPKSTPVKKNIENAELNTLGDDILNKYADNENQSLFTLKTNKKNTKE